MEDLIVILLLLVFTVVGGLAQLKKKKKQPVAGNAGNDKPEMPDFWATLLGEDEGMHQNQAAYERVAHEQGSKEAEQKEEVTPNKERFSTIGKRKAQHFYDIKQSEIGGEENEESILSDFSLRKAVVYSIIINRKYN
ncbi:MAG: hypothetical protein GXO81_02400 [Chlorobi bacterium]|nr:hypothetical protein [Chlorobiota bacterium]